MSKRIKVSVVIPVYNVERYLAECMDGILEQTLKDIEIICIDDGSTDRSLRILREYERKDSRVRVLTRENAGAASARNAGMELAQGEYLSFLDADDFYEADMLEKAYLCAKEKQADITIFRGNRYDDTRECYIPMDYSIKEWQLPGKNPFSWRDMPDEIFTFAVGWAWDKLYLRSFVEREQLRFQELRTSNDLYFVFSSFVKAGSICTMKELLVHHRIHVKGSLSVTRERSWNCFYEACTALQDELVRMGVYPELERGFLNWALHFCFWNLDTIEGPAYEKVYGLLCRECSDRFGFFRHEREYYVQTELYDRLLRMRELTCVEYLLTENRRLSEAERKARHEAKELQQEVAGIRNSLTFRTGRILTALPGGIKRLVRSRFRKHPHQ